METEDFENTERSQNDVGSSSNYIVVDPIQGGPERHHQQSLIE